MNVSINLPINQPMNCGEVYLDALEHIQERMGSLVLILLVLVITDWIMRILWKRGKIEDAGYHKIMFITLGIRVFWIFTWFGILFLGI